MKDSYRFENLSPEDLDHAKQMMANEGILPNHIDRIFASPDAAAAFNRRPVELREQFFIKTGAAIPDLNSILDERLKSAPQQKAPDLNQIIDERIADIQKEQRTAAQREQQVLAAAVPRVGPQGQVLDTAAAPPPTTRARSFQDYLNIAKQALRPDIVPAAETVAALGSQAVVAPVAAGAQAGADIVRRYFRGQGPEAGSPLYKEIMETATYQPRTEGAKSALQELGQAFEASKLPPVVTGAPPTVLPKAVAPAQKPKISYQEFQAQRGIISPDPVGLPGMASVGAAGRKDPVAVRAAIDSLPVELRAQASQVPTQNVNLTALETHAKALNLPEPIQLTRGQATGDLVALSNELNRRGELPNIAQRLGDQNQALIKNLTLIRDRAAPDAFGGMSDLGKQVIDGYTAIDQVRKDNIRQLYGKLEQAAGGSFPIDAQKFVSSADQQLKQKLKSEFLPPEIDRQLQSYRDGARMDFEQFEALRTNLASEIRKAERFGDGNRAMALSLVRDSLESLPMTGASAQLKAMADAARKAAKERFDALRKDPAYKAAIDEKVAPENFIETFVLSKGKGTEANVRQMMSALGKGTPEQQAVAAGIMEIISRKAIDGQGNFSQAAYNKILRELEPKLLEVFDADTARNLRDLGDISRKVMAQPKGGFANNSNTLVAGLGLGKKISEGAETLLNVAVPGASLGTQAVLARQKRTAQKFERETLEPLAGVKQPRTISDIFRGNQ